MADTGLGSAILQGMNAGAFLGDRIAALRSNNRMQDLQSQIDSGAFDPKNFGGDPAAAQQALQAAVRNVQEPLSARGLDPSYGSDQYGRLQGLQAMRYNQQGAGMVNAGDVAGGARRGAMGSAVLGDMQGTISANQYAGNVDAGNAAINRTGAVDANGVQPGAVNQQQLAQGVSANAAQYGDTQGASAWGGQEMQQREAMLQQNLGRAMTIAMNPALGGMQAAAGHFDAAAKLAGYGGVQQDGRGNLYVVDQQGNVTVQLTPENIQQFAQTVGNDPTSILSNLRAVQQQRAGDEREWQKTVNTKALDESLKAAGTAFDPAILRSLSREAAASSAAAKAGGWDMVGQAQDITDASGNPVGKAYLIKNEATGQPMRMVVSSSTGEDGTNPIQLTDYQGRPIDPNSLPAKAAASLKLAQQAAMDKAKADFYELGANQAAARMQGIEAVRRNYGGNGGNGGAMGGFSIPGQQAPQSSTTAPLTPQGNTGWEKAARSYQSPLVALDLAQMQQESGGNQGAVSSAGARGVMQLMPATARELEKQLGMPEGETDRNPAANFYAGRVYRDQLYRQAIAQGADPQSAVQYALAAFNAGPAGLQRQVSSGRLARETAAYGPAIMGKAGKGGKNPTTPAPLPKLSGESARPIQARSLNASLTTNADRFLLGR